MKAIYCLLALSFFAGSVTSEFAWKNGKSYTYAVRGRLMNGVAEINTQYAGLEMDYKVVMTVTGSNTVNWKATDFKLFEVNDVLNGGWRDGELVNEKPVELKPEFREYLESPMDITFRQGVIESIKVDQRLPTWAINIKKAQASHFVLDTTGVNAVLIGNLNRKTEQVRPEEHKHISGFFYETMEKTVHGECKTYYTVSQSAPFRRPFPFQKQAQPGVSSNEESMEMETMTMGHEHEHTNEHGLFPEHPWHQVYHELCQQNDQVYEIIKSVNFTACKNKPVLAFNAPSMLLNDRAGDNGFGSMGTRSLVSRILACGKDRKQFTILKIRQEELVKVGLHLTKKIVSGAIKNLTLIEMTNAKNPFPVRNPKVINNIVYKFAQHKPAHEMEEMMQSDAAYMNMHHDESEEEKSTEEMMTRDEDVVLPKPTLRDAPVLPMLITPLKLDGMKQRIEFLIHEVIQDTLHHSGKEGMAEKETLGKISTISKVLRYMPYQVVEELYHKLANKHETAEDKTARSVFLDCVAIAGTNPNIKLLIDLIQKKEIVGERASQILMTLPMYIRTPTKELLKEYFNLLKSDVLRTDRQVRTTAVLSFSTILYEACMNTKIRNSRYPVALYGKFCDAQVVEQEYLPWFVQELERTMKSHTAEDRHWRVVYLNALGNIGHPSFIPVVQRLMDNRQHPLLKAKIIFSLKHMILSRSSQKAPERQIHVADREFHDVVTDEVVEKKVLPLLMSAAFDKGEHPEVRMAAITLLIHTTNADRTIWQQLAYSTWFEVSQEVHSFIYNTLKGLTDLKHPMHQLHRNMLHKARQVLSICKPITAGWTKSRSIMVADWIPEFLSGYFHQFTYYGSKDSMIPNMMYYRNYYQFGEKGLGVNPLEVSFYGHTVQKLINHVVEHFVKPSSTADHEGHQDLSHIQQLLGIETRKQTEAVEGHLMIKIRNEMERMFTINKETIEKYAEKLMKETLPKLKNGIPIHYQKTFRFSELSYEVPSIFGLPLNYKFRMPVHFSLRGNLKVVNENGLKDIQIQADLHPVYAWKAHDKLSFKVPFLNKKYMTGLQNHVVAEIPFRAVIRRAPRGQVVVAITPTHIAQGRTPNEELNLVTFHQKPYTVIKTDECWPTSHKEGGEWKIVHALETPYTNDQRFGEKPLGLSLRIHEETDFRVQRETSSGWMHFWTRFHSPAGWFNLGWLGSPSVRFSKRKLTLDMSRSETKTLAFVFGGKLHYDAQETAEHSNRVYAIALIGKKHPIQSIKASSSEIEKILTKGTESTINYVWEIKSARGKVNVRVAAGAAAKEAVNKLPQNVPSLQAIREYVAECPLAQIQHDFCIELNGEIHRPNWANIKELIVLRKRLLSQELNVNLKSELKFGKTCSSLSHQIQMEGTLKRGPKMTEWAKDKSPQAKKCIEDEKKGFTVSPVCLWVSEQQAAALNTGKLHFTFTDLPVAFKHYAYKVEDFVKAWFYPYVTHERFPETPVGEKKFVLDFEMTPDREFLTVHVDKPTTRLSFRNVRMNTVMKKVLPFTATQTIFENVRDKTLRFYSEPSCTLEGRFVNTFDNVTYSFGKNVAPGCTHVLTKDCSGKYPMAVLVKDIHTERKTVTILLGGKTKIVIKANSGSSLTHWTQRGEMNVLVNNQAVTAFPKVIHAHEAEKYIARIETMVNGGIQVITPRIRVATDGARVVIYGHNVHRNRTCGLCGDFNGEKIADMRSPKNCPLSSGSLLVASYAFPAFQSEGRDECKIQPEIKKRIENENRDCLAHHTHFTTANTMEESEEIREDECNVMEKLTKQFPGIGRCASQQPIRRCAPGCHAEDTKERNVVFKCYQRTMRPTESYVLKNLEVEVPTNCVRN